MQNRDKIISKIQKLLALADNNPNEAECIAAALKAQKLISEYDVEDSELYDVEEPLVEYFTYKFTRKIWRGYLAAIIADNFRCKSYIKTVRDFEDDFKLRNTCCFIGYKHDVQAALLVYDKCVEIGERLAKERFDYYKRIYGSAEGVKNTFLEGFCSGIREELSKQCYALALTTPEGVIKYMNNLNLNTTTFSPNVTSFDDYSEGVARGKDAIRSSRLEKGNLNMLPSFS